MRRFLLIFSFLWIAALAESQIPAGFVQVTATVPSLANGQYSAAWTNLSSSSQKPLLGGVSVFQTTVGGQFNSNGFFSVQVADNNQIIPTPSTWTWSLTFHCGGTPPVINGGFMVAIPITGGGGTQDISTQITAALPSNPCSGGGGGGGGAPSPPAFTVQAANNAATALTSDPAITINTSSHSLNVGGPITTNAVTIGPHATPASSWTFDTYSPATACASIGCLSIFSDSQFSTFSAACAAAVAANATLQVSKVWTLLPVQTCSANLLFLVGNTGTGNLQPASGQVLTLTGTITAPNTKIFDLSQGSGAAIALGALTTSAPVQWWGAVGDSDAIGSTGTDNTAAIQACFSDVFVGAECFFSAGNYKITAPVQILRSGVSARGVAASFTFPLAWTTPSPSRIVTPNATGDVLDVWGTNSSTTLTQNKVSDLTLTRGTAPGAGFNVANGLSVKYTFSTMVQNVTAEDQAGGFYLKGVGASDSGFFENCEAIWGANGFVETSGTFAGFFIDTTDGTSSPSVRIRNSGASSLIPIGNTGVTTYGLLAQGMQPHDLHVFHFESSQLNYGEAVLMPGPSSFGASSDIFIDDSVNDNCFTSCIIISELGGSGTVQILGGWNYQVSNSPATPVIDIETASHVLISGQQLYFPTGTGPGILVNNSGTVRIANNDFIGNNTAVSFTTVSASTITGNIINGTATTLVSLVGSPGNSVSGNSINGTATNGILIDAASTDIAGIESNQIGLAALGVITTAINDPSLNGATFIDGGTNIVYRCATAGAAPVGTLTINAAACGTTTDTGLRVQ